MVMKMIRMTKPPSSHPMIRARSRWRRTISSSILGMSANQPAIGDQYREEREEIKDRISEQLLLGRHLRRVRRAISHHTGCEDQEHRAEHGRADAISAPGETS